MKIKELAEAAYEAELAQLHEGWQTDLDIALTAHNYSAHYDDTRRPRLTMRHLQRLRKMKDIERVEAKAHAELVATMYDYIPPKPKDESDFRVFHL